MPSSTTGVSPELQPKSGLAADSAFTDLETARQQAECTVRGFYVFEHNLEVVEPASFAEAWQQGLEPLGLDAAMSNPVLFLDIQTDISSESARIVFLAGLAVPTSDGFLMRQLLLSESRFQKSMLVFLVSEISKARIIVANNAIGRELKQIAEACEAVAVPFSAAGLETVNVGSLSRRLLGQEAGFPETVRDLLEDDYEMSSAACANVFSGWERVRRKPADETGFPLKDHMNRTGYGYVYGSYLPNPDQLNRMLTQNRIRVEAVIATTEAICRAAADPNRQSASSLISRGHRSQVRRDWEGALDYYRLALERATEEDDRLLAEMKISMVYKQGRRFVEALAIWNRLADKGVLRAMRELVFFYQKIDPDPSKVLELCRKFRAMGIDQVDSGWMQYRQLAAEARLAGKPSLESEYEWRRAGHGYSYPSLSGNIDVSESHRRGRLIRTPEKKRGGRWW